MNKEQSNKLNSYYAVRGVLEDNRGIIEPLALMGQAVEEFYRKVSEIDAVASRTKKGTGGASAAKKLAKEKLARLASSLAKTDTSTPSFMIGMGGRGRHWARLTTIPW